MSACLIEADARDTTAILTQAARTLDLSQPVGIMLIAVLHCIPDADHPDAGIPRSLLFRVLGFVNRLS